MERIMTTKELHILKSLIEWKGHVHECATWCDDSSHENPAVLRGVVHCVIFVRH